MKKQIFDTLALNALPISEVAERYTNVVRKGTSLFCLCPSHDDHHPSMDVTGKKINRAKCYSCGASLSPIDFAMAVNGWDFKKTCEEMSREFNIDILEEEMEYDGNSKKHAIRSVGGTRKAKKFSDLLNEQKAIVEKSIRRGVVPAIEKNLNYIPEEFIVESSDNTFCECLRSIFVPEGIEYAVKLYKLGSYRLGEKEGFVMFPSIDMEGRCHNIKIQRYCTDKSSPKYFHKEQNANYWLASILQNQGKLPKGNYDSTCFFGEHLLTQYPSDTVVLVESPKTAVLGAVGYEGYIWLATGNKTNISRERLQCLQNRNVIVIPDNDALDEWQQKISQMSDIATFVFSSFCDLELSKTGEKGDVGDYIIERV